MGLVGVNSEAVNAVERYRVQSIILKQQNKLPCTGFMQRCLHIT